VHHDDLTLHNVAELVDVDGREGRLLQRVPESVRAGPNDGARTRVRHPAGVELRFVPDGPVEVTLSSTRPKSRETSTVRVFWGPFRETVEHEVSPEPTTIRVSRPESLDDLDPDVAGTLRFDPGVCRIVLPGERRGGQVCYHGVTGDRRPPREGELPGETYLAYGTSITEGERALGEHLTYVNRAATELGVDAINLGTCGSAYCDPAMAAFIAEWDDWDLATLSLSVNMLGEFGAEEFRDRAEHMVETVAGAHPEKPVVAITLYPSCHDVGACDAAGAERFREELRAVVAGYPGENVRLLEGTDALGNVGGLTTDLIHPSDDATIEMGRAVAAELRSRR
jgi:hypothetical protein